MQQPAVMLVESATARKSVSAGMPSSAKLVGRPISLINAASASIPAAAVSSSLPLGAMPQTFCAQRVNRAVPEHNLTIRQALEMYTVNGAYALFEDKQKGMLAPGYLADIVVLDRDLMAVPKAQLEQACVTVTIKSGSVLYSQQ